MKRRSLMVEMMAVSLVLVIASTVGYCFYLQPIFMQYLSLRTEVKNNTTQLLQKQNQAIHEKSVHASLIQWRTNHPHFCQSIESLQTLNQLLQPLTAVIKQANFVVTDIQLMPPPRKKSLDSMVQLKISGKFQHLFSLIDAINHFQYPIIINQLTINQDHVYQLELTMRGLHD